MKYINKKKQMQMLEENRIDELIVYAEEHNLARPVVRALLEKVRLQQTDQKVSIH